MKKNYVIGKKYNLNSTVANLFGGSAKLYDYFVPVFEGTRNVLIVAVPSQGTNNEFPYWVHPDDLIGLVEYKEEILDINHKGETFQLDLRKARQMGLIK